MSKSNDSFLSIADLWHLCAARWRWFVGSVLLCLLLAVMYLLTTPFLYTRKASILVRQEVIGNNATEKNGKDFNEIGFIKQNNDINDVVSHLTSLNVLLEVARNLNDSLRENKLFAKAKEIRSRLLAENDGKGSAIINLTYKDYSTAEAERVLQSVIQVYNDIWLRDKYLTTQNTSRFIDSRLELLERDLGIVDDSISSFKSRYGITELENVSNIYLEQQSKADADILKLMNQKAMAEYIRSLLDNKSSHNQLLLVNSGINNTLIESQITLYNSTLLQMQSHLEYTSGQNPLIINLEKELSSLRKNILANVINHIRTIDIELKSLQDYHGLTSRKISSNPEHAKYLISIEREQKVKESLYVYLLQKKEENEISVSYKSAPIQILDPPNGSGKPTSPKRLMVLFAAVLLGLLMPITVIFLQATFNETVRNSKDIMSLSHIELLGVVPENEHVRTLWKLYRMITKKEDLVGIIVEDGKQNPINEAFRRLRTKIERMLPIDHDEGAKVFMMTSFNKNAGKTFISTNLALTLAIHKKHVLFVDADLRHGVASQIFKAQGHGLADYLNGTEQHLSSLLIHHADHPTLDVLPAGTIPSNPTELLATDRFCQFVDSQRSQYDVIMIDTPHADEYADAEIIEQHVDMRLFVARAGLLKRQRLDELESMQGRAKPLTVVLNAVESFYYKS